MKYHKRVLGTQHVFYMNITEKTQSKCRKICYKEKDRGWKREIRKKALSLRTAIAEMEMQKKSELVDSSCKSHEISQNSLGDTTCFLQGSFQIPEQLSCGNNLQNNYNRKHKRV